MSQEVGQAELQERTQQLLDGPLKHIRAAALAAALLPLASVAAAPASAQTVCASGGVCGTVFNDANANGIQDAGDSVSEGVKVFVCQLCDGTDTIETETGPDGSYTLGVPDNFYYTVSVLIPTGMQVSPPNIDNDAFDSDGVPNGPFSSVMRVLAEVNAPATDFGFSTSPVASPGTGTPGYWKNHPEAWPVEDIVVGGVSYTRDQAIAWLRRVGKDKTTTMFSSLVPAMLNAIIGNDDSCVNGTIADADKWMAAYGPVGSNVAASSYAWKIGEPLHQQMDSYNNGLLCAPHRE